MPQKRLRIFAGPNEWSGKSTFIQNFPSTPNLKLGYYVNADDIEQAFCLELNQFGISSSTNDIQTYFKKSEFAPIRLNDENLWQNFSVEENKLKVNYTLSINSYIAADIAEFIRQNILKSGLSFSINRVDLRVAHGHSVDKEIIQKRYYKSLDNLKEAVLISDRAYLFDNSGKLSILIAEVDSKKVTVIDPENAPNWFSKYLYEK